MDLLQRIENIENAMRSNYQQQGWLQAYTKLSKSLKEHTDRLYELSKQQTTNSKEVEDLRRYEAFEAIQEKFQLLRLLEGMNDDNKQALQRLLDDMEFAAQKEEEERALLTNVQKELEESKRHMRSVSEKVERIYHIQGARNVLNVDLQSLHDIMASLTQKKEALVQTIAELNNKISALQTELNTLRTSQQVLAPHRSMLAQGSRLLLSLSVMNNLKSELDIIDAELQENTQKQQELTNAWNSLSLEIGNVEATIESLGTQLKSHRESVRGTDSYTLQKRVLTLENRQKLLRCAQIHWRHIREGHDEIENTSTTLSEMRNRMEGVQAALAKVGGEVSELQTEYRYHAAVLQSKLRQQEEHQKELTELQTREDMLTESMQRLRERQSQLSEEWQNNYATLDDSLVECSPSTNMEARAEMLDLLLSNAERSAKEATEEMNNFNFHNERIQALNAELRDREAKRDEVAKQMNDVDTERQVLQRQAEYLNKRHTTSHANFTAVYNELNAVITLPDWMKQWEANNEGMHTRIADMVEQWDSSLLRSSQLKRDMQEVNSLLLLEQEQAAFVDASMQRLQAMLESRTTMLEEGEKEMQQALDSAREEEFYESSFQRLLEAYEAVERQTAEYLNAASSFFETQGREATMQSVGKRVEEQLSLVRFNLDVWISQYNTSHSPVQYEELRRTFSLDVDWDSIRQRVRHLQQSIAVEQEMIRYLNEDLQALKTTASRASTDISELSLWSLQKLMDTLRQQLRDVATKTEEDLTRGDKARP